MTQQKSDHCTVRQARRKAGPTQGDERLGGRKAVAVEQQPRQLGLCFVTAENPQGAVGQADADLSAPAKRAAPKTKNKDKRASAVTMEEVCRLLEVAFEQVASNQGAPGPDRQSVEQVRKSLSKTLPMLRKALLEGTYEAGEIRRVWIPKQGGQRGLGIPNVADRMIQEAVRLVLEPLYEPTFHESSHGFRRGRSCHTAIAQAVKYLDDGCEWIVDLDLEKFFDQVNHQRLMARLAQRVDDKRLLVLIGKMLKAKVIMPDGVVVNTEEGVPQGGPLSPLLSNVVLDELDQELERRGHRFVRYADDANIYVRSERAGQRVMQSVVKFIEGRMRLKVNRNKSAVARTQDRHFLGFSLKREPKEAEVEVLLSKRSQERLNNKVRELTPRNWGRSLRACIAQINEYLRGWLSHFCICTAGIEAKLQAVDAHVRRRLRAIQLAHWKCKRTIARRLIQLGVSSKQAWRTVYDGRKSRWRLSHTTAVHRGLRNVYFTERGLLSAADLRQQTFKNIVAPVQLTLQLG